MANSQALAALTAVRRSERLDRSGRQSFSTDNRVELSAPIQRLCCSQSCPSFPVLPSAQTSSPINRQSLQRKWKMPLKLGTLSGSAVSRVCDCLVNDGFSGLRAASHPQLASLPDSAPTSRAVQALRGQARPEGLPLISSASLTGWAHV